MIKQTKKLRLDELKVDSFVTSMNQGLQTLAIVGASGVGERVCTTDTGGGSTSDSGGTTGGTTGGTGGSPASQVESCQLNSVCRCTMEPQFFCASDSICS